MNLKFAIVAAEFNEVIVQRLLTGATDALKANGVTADAIETYRVPGAFELALTAQELARTGRFAAIICLGAVIRGDTDHYDFVCQAATQGILQAGLGTGVPVLFGVLTCDDEDQALQRAGGVHGNKGTDCALAALDMAKLLRQVRNTGISNNSGHM